MFVLPLSLLHGCSSKEQFWSNPKILSLIFYTHRLKRTKSVLLGQVYHQSSSMVVQISINRDDSTQKDVVPFRKVSPVSSFWIPQKGFEQVLQQLRREKTNGSHHRRSLRPVKKSVKFVPHATIYPVRHLKDYYKEDINRMWYSEQEWKQIKYDLYADVALLSDKSIVSATEICDNLRGLESRTPQGHQRRKRDRAWALAAVLEEQEIQWNHGHNDPNALAAVYHEYSQAGADAARTLGLEDELQAKLAYIDDADALLDLYRQNPKQSCVTRKATKDCTPPTMSTTRMA